jgi:hypothetical protein
VEHWSEKESIMELGGDEKRIQALFSEFALENRTGAPGFETLWTQAQATAPARGRRVTGPVLSVAATLAASLLSVAFWYQSSQSDHAINIAPQQIPTPAAPDRLTWNMEFVKPRPAHHRKPVRQKQSERALTSEMALLSSWQSPTETFLQSPAVPLNSLPQLNQSAQDLKEFLKKESNQ